MANHAWAKHNIPLAGGANNWARIVTGTPSLSNITSVEVHQDTWDSGFSVYYDGLHFWTAGNLPPGGPSPPPGVNANAIAPRVLLYVFDPIMENRGGIRMHQVYGWGDPVSLTNQVVSDLNQSSHGLVNYNVVDTKVVDAYPYFEDGYQQNDASFVTAWEGSPRDFHPQSHFDYVRFAQENNIAQRIDNGDLNEVWIYAPPIAGLWKSAMGGNGAYWINGPTQAVPSQRAFAMMGCIFERGVGEAIHSFGHRAESILDHIYGTQSPDQTTTWDKFAFQDRYAPGQGLGGVGNVHFPVNGTSDYDWFNQTAVLSNADDWNNYPNLTGTKRFINAREWSPNGVDPQREYLNWWYSHFPHVGGRGTDYELANWWRYVTDIDQFKSFNGNLYYTTGIPTVQLAGPTSGSHVSGNVQVSANAAADGALGRVDLYVDGNYYATDTVGPFNFVWDTSHLSGQHSLVAKAYELQNGTEAVSAPLSLTVDTLVIGDYNNNHLVDAADYVLFRKYRGSNQPLANDPIGGMIGQPQYNQWRTNFGSGGSTGTGGEFQESSIAIAGLPKAETPVDAALGSVASPQGKGEARGAIASVIGLTETNLRSEIGGKTQAELVPHQQTVHAEFAFGSVGLGTIRTDRRVERRRESVGMIKAEQRHDDALLAWLGSETDGRYEDRWTSFGARNREGFSSDVELIEESYDALDLAIAEVASEEI